MEFREDFFEKEILCNFEVSELMKRAWAAELESLQLVTTLCDRHGIRYFADGGTLLGVIRHQGFIPWDDDIDICLKREDYNRLVPVLLEELPHGFEVAGMFAKTRRFQGAEFGQQLRVIADKDKWDEAEYFKRFHGFPFSGVGIDIFPLDYMPRDAELVNTQTMIVRIGVAIVSHWDELKRAGELERRLSQMEEICGVSLPRDESAYNTVWRTLDSVCSLYDETEADEMTNFIYYINNPNFHVKKESYRDFIKMPFENMELAVPCGYEDYLTGQYGDYRQFVKNQSKHGYPFYGEQEKKLRQHLAESGFAGTLEEYCAEKAR